jgi:hypothetical protein
VKGVSDRRRAGMAKGSDNKGEKLNVQDDQKTRSGA